MVVRMMIVLVNLDGGGVKLLACALVGYISVETWASFIVLLALGLGSGEKNRAGHLIFIS